jgi:hypothetical protein
MIRPPRGILGTTFWITKMGPYRAVPMTMSMFSLVSSISDLGEPLRALLTEYIGQLSSFPR